MSNSEINTDNLSEESRTQSVIFNIQSPLNAEYWIQVPTIFPIKVIAMKAFCRSGSFNISVAKRKGVDVTSLVDFEEIPISDDYTIVNGTNHASNNIDTGDWWYFVITNTTSATLAAIQFDYIRQFETE
jgi:hypothetical protein